ncbi:hypothetical protein P175DRAFT_0507472 [Aspergillus ochraceoroseus IBT 24754]|uniref:Zn(2)-C6 fungal-type domain-containing protein n=1 Tax=Aspergillus ochraceoroseus IBT 24754 TaxID=1392256 RepID=A0A2T5M2A0_9EURO|nr:uncharacterized protein P175DRAFT_0507472 [Aspergillus ochraceoroseus IBT 24754]PTU22657.1 hypothetical protein P175DRAFT_0507472 [Aspergillus ochraceoroseus IBT 24754]
MVDRTAAVKASVRLAPACTECQRRKQKCSREWPCNHCQARRIAHLCKFTPKKVLRTAKTAADDPREPEAPKELDITDHEPLQNIDLTSVSNYDDFRALGYLPDFQGAPDDISTADKSPVIPPNLPGTRSSEVENALRVLPPKPYIDILIQHFLNNTNYHYCALYPPAFLSDYSTWWSRKSNGQPITSEFTCLLLRVCACSAPYLDDELREKLESELGESIEHQSRLYHNAAKQISSTIAPGKGGLIQVQQLFLTAQWLKTESLFVESWHALGVAIHEAQEQGMHKSSSNPKIPEFDREMRKRVWCILYTWDWQMSLLLSRPFIINSSYCAFELPNLRLESVDSEPECPSPVAHMVLECQLGLAISKIPGVMGGVLSPMQAMSIHQEVENWSDSFPPPYAVPHPDTKWDDSHQFIKLQRHTLNLIGHMVKLMPLKQCLTKYIDPNSPSIERSLRENAVECAMKLIRTCAEMLEYLSPFNAKFHFAPFLIFDTAALLCSAIVHDKSRTLPQHESIIETIDIALDQLDRISRVSGIVKTGSICYSVLNKLVAKLPISREAAPVSSKSPQSSIDAPQTLPNMHIPNTDPSFCFPTTVPPLDTLDPELITPTGPDLFPSEPMINNLDGFSDILQVDLGELGQIWDWENLDLNLQNTTFI